MENRLVGVVAKGEEVGAKFGVATANLRLEKVPKIDFGVYFCWVKTLEKPAILHFGTRKTFGRSFSCELHILEFAQNIYGKKLEIWVEFFWRKTKKFQNADALFSQIENDISAGKKYFLRKEMEQKWAEITSKQKKIWSEKAVQKIEKEKDFQVSQNIFVFAPSGSELEFVKILCQKWEEKKTFFFPKIINKNSGEMEFFSSKFENLEVGVFGILEPKSGEKSAPDLVILPALAVDKNRNRLGKGGGFYDRFLAKNKSIKTICALPKFAVLKKIPAQNHDQKVDKILEI